MSPGKTHTIVEMFESTAKWNPDKTALVQAFDDREYTYSEVSELSNRIANGLADMGVESGDRIAFVTDLFVEHTITWLGTVKSGAIPAPLHVRETPATLADMVDRVDADVLVFQPSKHGEKIEQLRSQYDPVDDYVAYDVQGETPPEYATPFETLADAPSSAPDVSISSDDTAFINFSSGTTGTPKPIVHTHFETVECAHLGFLMFDAGKGDVNLNAFPTSFVGFVSMTFPFFAAGGTVVNMEDWDPTSIPDVIDGEAVTMLILTPTQYKLVLQQNDLEEYDMDSLEKIGYGGEVLGSDLFNTLQEKLSENVFSLYGSTETISFATALLPEDITEENLDSVGKPGPNVDVRIIEPDSNDPTAQRERTEIGEIAIRGPSLAEEVWDDPEKTAEIFHEDGWWFTGDLGSIGEDDNLYIEGRTDNMIVSGGMNIFAEKVENVVEKHPDVTECAVVGVPHEKWNEAVKAFVVGEGVTEDDLEQWCKDDDELADYQRPKEYEFLDELPRSNTGKLNRSGLRES